MLEDDDVNDNQGSGGNSSIMDGMDIGEEKNDLDKIFDKMLDPKNIYHFTELNQSEITAFSTLGVLAKKYDIDIIKEWIVQNLMMRVSKQRKGKLEFVKITARNGSQDQPQQNGGWNFFRR